jgi:hypothetical protein
MVAVVVFRLSFEWAAPGAAGQAPASNAATAS